MVIRKPANAILDEHSWPPSQAPPPGATPCSMMAILTSGAILDISYAHERPAEPAPTITMSVSAYLSMSAK